MFDLFYLNFFQFAFHRNYLQSSFLCLIWFILNFFQFAFHKNYLQSSFCMFDLIYLNFFQFAFHRNYLQFFICNSYFSMVLHLYLFNLHFKNTWRAPCIPSARSHARRLCMRVQDGRRHLARRLHPPLLCGHLAAWEDAARHGAVHQGPLRRAGTARRSLEAAIKQLLARRRPHRRAAVCLFLGGSCSLRYELPPFFSTWHWNYGEFTNN